MSEKKSWDVARKPVAKAPVREQPATRTAPARPQVAVKDVRPSPRVAPRSKERLRDRRQKKQRMALLIAVVLLIITVSGGVYLSWRPAFRIGEVVVEGPHAEEVRALATQTLRGTYFFLIPRNSIYFFPTEMLRTKILAEYPNISAVSITRASFESIKITSLPRSSTFLWCGESILSGNAEGNCYHTDSEGLIYENANTAETPMVPLETSDISSTSTTTTSTSTTPILHKKIAGELKLYSSITRNPEDPNNPIQAHIANANRIPGALAFIKALGELGISISTIEISGDEANLYTPSHTRIAYVLGREESALALAKAVTPKLSFTDNSIEYLDLRFSGKAYIKRTGKEPVAN